MPELPFTLGSMLHAPTVTWQKLLAVEQLAAALARYDIADPWAHAYRSCDAWQRRFQTLLTRPEIPAWTGLTAFRFSIDYLVPASRASEILPPEPPAPVAADPSDRIASPDEFWRMYRAYIDERQDIFSGKPRLVPGGAVEAHLMQQVQLCRPLPGGQAGNVAWLWYCIGANARAYTMYFSSDIQELPVRLAEFAPGLSRRLPAMNVLRLEDQRPRVEPIERAPAGVRQGQDGADRVRAPSGGSVIITRDGRRLCFIFQGTRDLRLEPGSPLPWSSVRFTYEGELLPDGEFSPSSDGDRSWPSIPLFGECSIDGHGTLVVDLAGDDVMAEIARDVDFAVIGGLDYLFFPDVPLPGQPVTLRTRLIAIAERQLRTLAASGVRIGVEISGPPGRGYATFLARLCGDGIVVAVGINGIDELPGVTGENALKHDLPHFWFDPRSDPEALRSLGELPGEELLTYLRAKTLAQALSVRTLFVHTNTVDLILRRDADPGALVRAQEADLLGKGLVIAALLQRGYGDSWTVHGKAMPATVSPRAMESLGAFAVQLAKWEKRPELVGRLLTSGYWLARSSDQYSLAAVPIIWPAVTEGAASAPLPPDLNTTGAGDMTFAAFMLLGGV